MLGSFMVFKICLRKSRATFWFDQIFEHFFSKKDNLRVFLGKNALN
jgi:hypothetical protein